MKPQPWWQLVLALGTVKLQPRQLVHRQAELLEITLLSSLIFTNVKSINAQITPDGTLGHEDSIVTPNVEVKGRLADLIEGGATRGNNLFHSFSEFNIGEGQAAYFANPAIIQNIFSRVTGINPSHLFGTLGVLGNANLYLINPNGIVFGPNASLDLRGSFISSTASEVIFPDGHKFSATNPQGIPLLTIDVQPTIGLVLGEDSGAIINAGDLNSGGNLTLIGSTVVNRGNLSASGGEVTILTVDSGSDTIAELDKTGKFLGFEQVAQNHSQFQSTPELSQLIDGVAEKLGLIIDQSGQVKLVESGLAIAQGDVVFAGQLDNILLDGTNILLSAANNLNLVNTQLNTNGGDITLHSGNDLSIINSKIDSVSNLANGGKITMMANGEIKLSQESMVDASGIGSGMIEIQGYKLSVSEGSQIIANTTGNNSGKNLNISTFELVEITGTSADGKIRSNVQSNNIGAGVGGNVNIETKNLTISDGASISTITLSEGTGGDLTIRAAEAIEISGNGFEDLNNLLILPFLGKPVTPADFAKITGIFSGTFGTGNSGNININTPFLLLTEGSVISNNTSLGQGQAGKINIRASEKIELIGAQIFAVTLLKSTGNAGDIIITTKKLIVREQAAISTSTLGMGKGGDVFIRASESVDVLTSTSTGIVPTGIFTNSIFGTGEGGNIDIDTSRLTIAQGARISSASGGINAFGIIPAGGQGGDINIKAADSLVITGMSDDTPFVSGLIVSTSTPANAGNLNIETNKLVVTDHAEISASTLVTGNAGNINIQANDSILLNNNANIASSNKAGGGGFIEINTKHLQVANGGQINTSASGIEKAGDITLNIIDKLTLTGENSGIFASTTDDSLGNAGSIFIKAKDLLIQDGAIITVENLGTGRGGNIDLLADFLTLDNESLISAQTESNTGGNITFQISELLTLRNASNISATAGTAQAGGDGGNINITSPFILAVPKENSDITANSFLGNGGNISIVTNGIFGLEVRNQPTIFSDITASSQFGLQGNININSAGIEPVRGLANLPEETVNSNVEVGCQSVGERNTSSFNVIDTGNLPHRFQETLDVDISEDKALDIFEQGWTPLSDSASTNRDGQVNLLFTNESKVSKIDQQELSFMVIPSCNAEK